MKRGYADTTLGQVHYRYGGSGSPLLLLHPGPRSSRYYWRLAPLLARHFSVMAPDTLGFGNSDPAPAAVTIAALADNIAEFLDRLGVARAHIFGMHTGNKIATALAVHRPEKIHGLILCGMTHSLVPDQEHRNAEIKKIIGHFHEPTPADQERRQIIDWAAGFRTIAEEWWRPDLLARAALGTDRFTQLEQRVIDVMQCRNSMAASRQAILEFDLAKGLRAIRLPTLIIELASAGESHLGRQGPKLLELLANGKLITFENADRDFLEFEAPRVAEVIRRHLTA
ncbi:MAG: alpha/beta hydrolase [Alphaproteobacteria bacterium]|nr:alpha/beta hydrolase [Alphaproteobacteria bacterium]